MSWKMQLSVFPEAANPLLCEPYNKYIKYNRVKEGIQLEDKTTYL